MSKLEDSYTRKTVEPSQISRDIAELMQDVRKHVMERLEIMAAAYVKFTDIPIEECELVVKIGPDEVTYTFRRKSQH